MINKLLIRLILLMVLIITSNIANADIFSITLENDIVTPTDRHYTHGTRLFNIFENPKCLDNYFENKEKKMGLSLAQHMYTPSNIKIAEYIENDRPYGGWLYLGTFLFLEDGNKLDIFNVDIGIIGPYSYAEETQKLIHKSLQCTIPQGWDNQLETEPGMDLGYQRKYKWAYNGIIDFDIIPHGGFVAGNVFTYGDIGGLIRIGNNLPNNFGYLYMEPSTRELSKTGYYIFGGCEGRYVLRNLFLDGSTFEESYSVDKKDLVGDINYGIGTFYGDLEVIVAYVIRSKEFNGQDHHNEFGTINFIWRY